MSKPENIVITEKPNLRRPYMVCGINGWVDGGEASTGTVEYLVDKLTATPFAEIPIDHFHVFQIPGQGSSRPHVKIEDGVIREHDLPGNQFSYWVNPNADHDLILFLGTEPNLHWQEFAETILYVARQFHVSRIYLLGGVLDKTPHTREPNVSCSCSTARLKEEMRKYAVQFSNYEGPARFGNTLLYLCRQRRIPMLSLTTRATYYPEFSIVISRNPKSIRALMTRLDSILQLGLDMSDLDAEAEEFEDRLGRMGSRNTEFRSYLENLESDYQEVRFQAPLEMSPGEAVRIAEELLRGNAEK